MATKNQTDLKDKSVSAPVSLFQLFSIGIGPSSSHTVGPMRAARQFASEIPNIEDLGSITIELFGSLAMTGKGHATDIALLLGLEGYTPEGIDPNQVPVIMSRIEKSGFLRVLGKVRIPFKMATHLLFQMGKRLPYHSNAMKLIAKDFSGKRARLKDLLLCWRRVCGDTRTDLPIGPARGVARF